VPAFGRDHRGGHRIHLVFATGVLLIGFGGGCSAMAR
jgi:hypothetical protein